MRPLRKAPLRKQNTINRYKRKSTFLTYIPEIELFKNEIRMEKITDR